MNQQGGACNRERLDEGVGIPQSGFGSQDAAADGRKRSSGQFDTPSTAPLRPGSPAAGYPGPVTWRRPPPAPADRHPRSRLSPSAGGAGCSAAGTLPDIPCNGPGGRTAASTLPLPFRQRAPSGEARRPIANHVGLPSWTTLDSQIHRSRTWEVRRQASGLQRRPLPPHPATKQNHPSEGQARCARNLPLRRVLSDLISEMAMSESFAGEFRRSVESWGERRERKVC